jgi:hypothetical protein
MIVKNGYSFRDLDQLKGVVENLLQRARERQAGRRRRKVSAWLCLMTSESVHGIEL